MDDPTICHEWENHTSQELETHELYRRYFEGSPAGTSGKLHHFPKYVTRQVMSKLFCRYELFKKILNVHGAIVEIGTCAGSGVFTYGHASSILEPFNYSRKILGFDTFSGFPDLDQKDRRGERQVQNIKVGAYSAEGLEGEVRQGIALYDRNRPLGHMPRIELVVGDVEETIPKYVKDHPELVVAMLNLDTGIYKPTRVALEHLLPLMPKGAILTFDTLGIGGFPGQNVAIQELVGIRNMRVQRMEFEPARTYAVLE
jgi:hypothetical protein